MIRPWLLALAACAGGTTGNNTPTTGSTATDTGTPDTTAPDPCGAGELFDMTVRGTAVDKADKPVAGAEVVFEERNWRPGIYGSAITDANGRFSVLGERMPLLYDKCWGRGVQFWVTAHTDSLEGDQPINTVLLEGLHDEQHSVDLSFPIFLDPVNRAR